MYAVFLIKNKRDWPSYRKCKRFSFLLEKALSLQQNIQLIFLVAYPPMEYLDSGVTHAFLRSMIILVHTIQNINNLFKFYHQKCTCNNNPKMFHMKVLSSFPLETVIRTFQCSRHKYREHLVLLHNS